MFKINSKLEPQLGVCRFISSFPKSFWSSGIRRIQDSMTLWHSHGSNHVLFLHPLFSDRLSLGSSECPWDSYSPGLSGTCDPPSSTSPVAGIKKYEPPRPIAIISFQAEALSLAPLPTELRLHGQQSAEGLTCNRSRSFFSSSSSDSNCLISRLKSKCQRNQIEAQRFSMRDKEIYNHYEIYLTFLQRNYGLK